MRGSSFVGLAVLLAILPVCGAHAGPFGSAAIVSDYVDRGLSNSDGEPAVQGEIGWAIDQGLFAAIAGSSVDFDDGDEATVELNYILGYARRLGDVDVTLSAARIAYPGASSTLDYDLWEFATAASAPLADGLSLAGELIWTPDNGGAGNALYGMASLSITLVEGLTVTPHAGHQWIEEETLAGPSYWDWGISAELDVRGITIGVAYTDTDLGQVCPDLCDARALAFVSATLP